MPGEPDGEINRGFQELQNNAFIASDESDGTGLADISDLAGVGPATARRLEDAGIEKPSDLYGLGQDEIMAVPGIGRKKAAQLRRQVLSTRQPRRA